ncbi:type VI secretion system lipoprotein TssJ [Erwinia sorbitola]|uniref:Type VI secretion system lipoprotein TssJ n=1 Tax=Erwinia sorbitola TaxID=2681984 RepID=A0ABW9RGP6_9GAMM|nr:type VI secretion system lipoprotein TssJ [Erwinia sorbitola]MTD29398.1 type VI secretion system lipoprotein TssJ [Erwinia sorbitola]
MLRTSLNKSALWLLPLLAVCLSGCGLTQGIADGTRSAVSSVFYKKITVLHLDFTGREALNTDARESHSSPQPLVIRVYQLRERKTFDTLVYQQLLTDGEVLLKDDLLASREVVLKPGNAASLDMPMEKETKFVAVVGLFRQPDLTHSRWQLVIKREAFDPVKARTLEASENSLTLQPLKEQ